MGWIQKYSLEKMFLCENCVFQLLWLYDSFQTYLVHFHIIITINTTHYVPVHESRHGWNQNRAMSFRAHALKQALFIPLIPNHGFLESTSVLKFQYFYSKIDCGNCFSGQQIPGVSPTGEWTTILPLLFILGVAAIKEIMEDQVSFCYFRHCLRNKRL